MLRITITDDFFEKELTGEFNDIDECTDFYACALDAFVDAIEILKIEILNPQENGFKFLDVERLAKI